MQNEIFVDIDQETKDFLNEIIEKTHEWVQKAENLQKTSKFGGFKIQLLGKVINRINDLYDFCAKN